MNVLLKGEQIKGKAGMALLPSEKDPSIKRWRKVVDDDNMSATPSPSPDEDDLGLPPPPPKPAKPQPVEPQYSIDELPPPPKFSGSKPEKVILQRDPSTLSFGEYTRDVQNPVAAKGQHLSLSQTVHSLGEMLDTPVPLTSLVNDQNYGELQSALDDFFVPPPPPIEATDVGKTLISQLKIQLSSLEQQIKDAIASGDFGALGDLGLKAAEVSERIGSLQSSESEEGEDLEDFAPPPPKNPLPTTTPKGESWYKAVEGIGLDPFSDSFYLENMDKTEEVWEKYGMILSPVEDADLSTNSNRTLSLKKADHINPKHYEKIMQEFEQINKVFPLKDLLKDKNIKLSVVPNSYVEGRSPKGSFREATNTVMMFDKGGGHTLLHEIIHALDANLEKGFASRQAKSKIRKQIDKLLVGYNPTKKLQEALKDLDPQTQYDLKRASPELQHKLLQKMKIYSSDEEPDATERYLYDPSERLARVMQQFLTYTQDSEETKDYVNRAGFWDDQFMSENATKLSSLAGSLGLQIPKEYVKQVKETAKKRTKQNKSV